VIAFASGLGAVAGLDRSAFGHTLLAHPAVVGTLLLGVSGASPDAWLFLMILTCLEASSPTVGGARDWGSAAVVGVVLGQGAGGATAWALVLMWSVAVAGVGGGAILGLQSVAGRSMRAMETAVERGDAGRIERIHFSLTFLHALRGGVVVGLGLVAGRYLLPRGLDLAAAAGVEGWLALIWTVAPWGALPVLCRLHWDRTRRVAMGMGLAGGLVLWAAGVMGGIG